MSNIQSALRSVAQAAGQHGVPMDRLLFGPAAGVMRQDHLESGGANAMPEMFTLADSIEEPVKQVAALDVMSAFQQHRQQIEAAMATKRDDVFSRMDPDWVAKNPEAGMQLTEAEAAKQVERTMPPRRQLIVGLQRDAIHSFQRIKDLTPEQMGLKGDWAIDAAQAGAD